MYLRKLPSGILKFVLFSIRTHQNLKKGSVNNFSVIYFKLWGNQNLVSKASNTQKYVKPENDPNHIVGKRMSALI